MNDDEKNIEVKEHDVFDFAYSEEYREEANKNHIDLNWCFDGQLIARKQNDESLLLVDTYWCGGDNKCFTVAEALERGKLTFKCNLNDVEKCSKYDLKYYMEEDIIDLSTQHHCYESYVKKKGAQRNKEVMLAYIERCIEEKEHDISWAQREIEQFKEKAEKIKSGEDINKIYL